jgi:hypothetical protein
MRWLGQRTYAAMGVRSRVCLLSPVAGLRCRRVQRRSDQRLAGPLGSRRCSLWLGAKGGSPESGRSGPSEVDGDDQPEGWAAR